MTLVLLAPSEQRADAHDLPGDVPVRRLEDAGVTLNHGILLAEILGIDGSEALTRINEVFGMVDQLPAAGAMKPIFIAEDLPVLVDVFYGVGEKLSVAIDDHGRPRGSIGTVLAASPHVEQVTDGSLIVRSHRLPVVELRDRLEALCLMLRFASSHGWLVEMEVS